MARNALMRNHVFSLRSGKEECAAPSASFVARSKIIRHSDSSPIDTPCFNTQKAIGASRHYSLAPRPIQGPPACPCFALALATGPSCCRTLLEITNGCNHNNECEFTYDQFIACDSRIRKFQNAALTSALYSADDFPADGEPSRRMSRWIPRLISGLRVTPQYYGIISASGRFKGDSTS